MTHLRLFSTRTLLATLAPVAVMAFAPDLAHAQSNREPDDGVSADRPLSDLPGYEVPFPDLVPIYWPSLAAPATGQAALSVVVTAQQRDARTAFSGSLVLSLPFDGFVRPRSATKAKTGDPKPIVDDAEPDAADAHHVEAETPPSTPLALPRIRSEDLRAAIAASEKRRGVAANQGHLHGMSTRARWGSLLPTVRLRATRLVDESVSLSPTSYDSERTTSRGGASLWLEARATWNLDRLVFATEEVRIEQLRRTARRDDDKASSSVIADMFAWQRAVFAMHDPALPNPACVRAWLDVQQLAAELDVATGGWFEAWSRGKAGPRPSCVDDYEVDAGRGR